MIIEWIASQLLKSNWPSFTSHWGSSLQPLRIDSINFLNGIFYNRWECNLIPNNLKNFFLVYAVKIVNQTSWEAQKDSFQRFCFTNRALLFVYHLEIFEFQSAACRFVVTPRRSDSEQFTSHQPPWSTNCSATKSSTSSKRPALTNLMISANRS